MLSLINLLWCCAPLALAAPFSFPLADGFPTPNATAQQQIFQAAGGQTPNAPLPPRISTAGIGNFRLLAFAEIFEVAFFTELLNNVTNNVPGYQLSSQQESFGVKQILQRIVAQEQEHALAANNALQSQNQSVIQPCQYNFPVSSLGAALALAQTFTDASLGVLPEAQRVFAQNGDLNFVQILGSIIGQEGEQDGLFRVAQGKSPSAAPFLTAVPPNFVFTAIQSFVVPGSCPNLNTIPFQTYQPLNVVTQNIQPVNQTLQFSWPQGQQTPTSIVYITGQNTPVVVPFNQTGTSNGLVQASASFPFQTPGGLFNQGLTIAAVTSNPGPFSSADAVANATLFGPGLIEVF